MGVDALAPAAFFKSLNRGLVLDETSGAVAEQVDERLENADHASDDVKRYSSQAKHKIEENPLPSVAIALGVGFILGALLIRGNHR